MRDVTIGPEGNVFIAVEHNENGSIWRLRPIAHEFSHLLSEPAYNTVMGLIALGEAKFLTNAQTID